MVCTRTCRALPLAGVMAHEISHGVARHGTEQLSKAYGFQVVAGLALGANPPIYQQLLAQIVGAGTFAAFGRDAEREADRLGVFTMHAAGYDPHGMVTMFQELLSRRDNQPGAVSQFFSSHPLTEDRITDVRAMIAELPPRSNLITRDAYHDWVLANERMAKVLADKGYPYQFVFARNAGHTDRAVKAQTLPAALEYVWQGYPIK